MSKQYKLCYVREAPYITESRISWVSGHARTIVGITESMELELGESEEGLK